MFTTSSESSEHASSYYAATLGKHPKYPQLQGHLRADVCVIGGGFSGVSTALHLAERGYAVVVLEAARIGWGASGRNGGQILGGFSMSEDSLAGKLGERDTQMLWDMGNEAVEIIKDRIDTYKIDCDLAWGYCDVALKPKHMDSFRATQESQQRKGYPYELRIVEKDELQQTIKSDLYLGGMFNDGYGHLHPLKLCVGEAAAAAALGVQIFEQSRVTKLVPGAQPVVKTAHGEIQAKYVVVCGDAYLGDAVPELSSRNLPAPSFVIATEPLGERQRAVMTENIAVCDQRWALDYFRFSAEGRLLFGGACNYSGFVPSNFAESMRQNMVKVFPQLADVRIDYAWGGNIGISMNRIPQVGCLHDNVYFAQGYSGHGVAPTHLMGRIVAEAIAGQAERFDIFSRFKHMPFPGGKLLRQPMYALGMLYYRLRDAL